jgi:hypothetical protein
MSEPTTKAPLPSITARTSAAEKARFTWLAERAGMSESALALLAIRSLIDPDGKAPPTITQAMERLAATDRMTIRLRPGDGTTIARRAAARGMKASAYVAALVRAHVRASPPLPAAELAALKKSVEVLGEVGHALDRLQRSPALSAADREALWKDISYIQLVLAGLEQQTSALAKAALIAWESRSE